MTRTNPTPKRRWFRFSLRMLLIVVVLLSLPLGWLASKMRQARQQGQAVEAIRAAGGVVLYDYEYGQPDPPVPTWLMELVGVDLFVDVVEVNFYDSEVTDAGLEHLKGMTNLKYLYLSDTQVTDGGLEHLNGMTNLLHLDLCTTQVTDAGLEHLKGMTSLKYLWLSGMQITDAGLEHLKGLTSLRVLGLSDTQVTKEGIVDLKKGIPSCRIGWDGPPNKLMSLP